MEEHDIPVRCCRCKHKHNESERIGKPHRTDSAITEMTCPRCGARSYFDMTPLVAYCWASGLIEFGETVPEGAIKIAHGPKADLKYEIEAAARHGKGASDGKLLVPGIPEAGDQRAAGDALASFIAWGSKRRSAKKYGVVFTSKGE
jgi:hypothetical protein